MFLKFPHDLAKGFRGALVVGGGDEEEPSGGGPPVFLSHWGLNEVISHCQSNTSSWRCSHETRDWRRAKVQSHEEDTLNTWVTASRELHEISERCSGMPWDTASRELHKTCEGCLECFNSLCGRWGETLFVTEVLMEIGPLAVAMSGGSKSFDQKLEMMTYLPGVFSIQNNPLTLSGNLLTTLKEKVLGAPWSHYRYLSLYT